MDPFTYLAETVLSLIAEFGPYGVLIGMILESSVIPIPSEAILTTAGLARIDLVDSLVRWSRLNDWSVDRISCWQIWRQTFSIQIRQVSTA